MTVKAKETPGEKVLKAIVAVEVKNAKARRSRLEDAFQDLLKAIDIVAEGIPNLPKGLSLVKIGAELSLVQNTGGNEAEPLVTAWVDLERDAQGTEDLVFHCKSYSADQDPTVENFKTVEEFVTSLARNLADDALTLSYMAEQAPLTPPRAPEPAEPLDEAAELRFVYKGINNKKEKNVAGVVSALSEADARNKLNKKGITATEIRQMPPKAKKK